MPEFEIDVVRIILLELRLPQSSHRWVFVPLGGFTEEQTLQGVRAALTGQLIAPLSWSYGKATVVYRMTDRGSEFIKVAKHIGNWNRAKELVRSKGRRFEIGSVLTELRDLRSPELPEQK
jgi:hypothetical protein